MSYKLERNPDRYTWAILRSDVTSGRLQYVLVESIGPKYVGENGRTIEHRARQALKRWQESANA